MKKMFIFIGAAAATAGFISVAPPASADPCAMVPPTERFQCAYNEQQRMHPDWGNRGTGDPAHNICQITGHDC